MSGELMFLTKICFILLILVVLYGLAKADKENIIEGPDAFEFGIASEANKTTQRSLSKLDLRSILIIIRSQHYKYHKRKAIELKKNLLYQAEQLNGEKNKLDVLMTHENWCPYGSWTILPIIKIISRDYSKGKKWVFFCEDTTEVNLEKLLQEWFLGHALRDTEPAIIHHFAFFEDPSKFSFPNFWAGWAISTPLLNWLQKRLEEDKPTMDFSIDVQHEIAMYIYKKGKGFNLTNVKEFCINKPLQDSSCATTVNKQTPNCGQVSSDDILVSVKTCEKFHEERLPIILKTIGRKAKHIKYYSDKADTKIPTEFIGVKNTESGHCTKLYNIIMKAHTEEGLKTKPWLVIIDDDTIISFSRLQRALACYDPKDPILLGERYGYGINYNSFGYEYITGGGGMILSRRGIELLVKSGCRCSSDDSPDDMWLGMCFRNMGIPSVHNPSFHQARPSEYVPELLQHQYLVSFHKHYLIDPMNVYKQYLKDD
eukprot:gene15205-6408_t